MSFSGKHIQRTPANVGENTLKLLVLICFMDKLTKSLTALQNMCVDMGTSTTSGNFLGKCTSLL